MRRKQAKDKLVKTRNGAIVLIPDWMQGKIKSVHSTPGQGSVFTGSWLRDAVKAAEGATITGGGGVYQGQGKGYDLVMSPRDIVRRWPGAKEIRAVKQEGPNKVKVRAFLVPDNLNKMPTTNVISIVARPTGDLKFVPPSLHADPEIVEAVESGRFYTMLSAWPGGEQPPASQWGDRLALIIPNMGQGAKSLQRVASSSLRNKLIRLAYARPGLRPHLLPLLAKTGRKNPNWR